MNRSHPFWQLPSIAILTLSLAACNGNGKQNANNPNAVKNPPSNSLTNLDKKVLDLPMEGTFDPEALSKTQQQENENSQVDSIPTEMASLEEGVDYELDQQGHDSLNSLENWINENPASYAEQMGEVQHEEELQASTDESVSDFWQFARRRSGGRSFTCRPVQGRILMGCCLMYVRMYMDKNKMIPNGTNLGIAARDSGNVLSNHGFCNMKSKYTARSAPINAALVYTGGKWGHIEIKTSKGYYFGPTNAGPATEWKRLKRTLTGIWMKCDKNTSTERDED